MRGAFRRPTVRWRRVLDSKSKASSNIANIYQAKLVIFKGPSLDLVLPPLYLSPGPRTFRRAGVKMTALSLCWPFFSIFSPSKKFFKICFEKKTKNVRKLKFLASQNHPKILPKCLRKRCPNKHTISHRFLLDFGCLSQRPTLQFCWQGHSFVSFSHYSLFRLLHAFWVQKTYRKPLQNDVRTLPKSMPKTCCFLTSIFLGFGVDFGWSWASKLEPSWLQKR